MGNATAIENSINALDRAAFETAQQSFAQVQENIQNL